MASPFHDTNHLKLARNIDDVIGAATLDGKKLTMASRNDLLNRANKYIQMYFRNDLIGAANWLSGLMGTSAITFAAAGASLPSDFSFELALGWDGSADTSDWLLKYVDPSKKVSLDSRINPNNQDCFTIFGGKIYAYKDNKRLESGAGTFYYIKTDERGAAADASDLSINSIWYNVLVEIATTFYSERMGQKGLEPKRIELMDAVVKQ